MSRAERRALVERENAALPISQQCRLLAVSRSSVYRQMAEVSAMDGAIMALIDRQYLARPYYGSRRMPRHCGPCQHTARLGWLALRQTVASHGCSCRGRPGGR